MRVNIILNTITTQHPLTCNGHLTDWQRNQVRKGETFTTGFTTQGQSSILLGSVFPWVRKKHKHYDAILPFFGTRLTLPGLPTTMIQYQTTNLFSTFFGTRLTLPTTMIQYQTTNLFSLFFGMRLTLPTTMIQYQTTNLWHETDSTNCHESISKHQFIQSLATVPSCICALISNVSKVQTIFLTEHLSDVAEAWHTIVKEKEMSG